MGQFITLLFGRHKAPFQVLRDRPRTTGTRALSCPATQGVRPFGGFLSSRRQIRHGKRVIEAVMAEISLGPQNNSFYIN